MLASEQLGKLTAALVAARAEISHPIRNKKGHHNNFYADLTAVLDSGSVMTTPVAEDQKPAPIPVPPPVTSTE